MEDIPEKEGNKRGQITIFVIIAIVLVAGIIFYFFAKDNLFKPEISATLDPAYKGFLTCLEEKTLEGIGILEQQGGYIELPNFVPGSSYMPFSSQLDFSGVPVPYWYYVNYYGTSEEQVPSKENMERDLENYLEQQVSYCNLNSFYENDFTFILNEDPKAKIDILGNEVRVNLNVNLNISKADESVVVKNHDVAVSSELGNLYEESKKLYDLEQETLFLEKYAVDNLRLYAPVDGVEISCAPKIWSADAVFQELGGAIELNTLALGVGENVVDKYYSIDFDTNYNVRFLNSKNWAHGFEVNPSEGNLLVANPVGNTPGLGILGFCYVPYHYVYNVYYPVLIQIYSENEIFQFPVAVVVEGNKEREAIPSISGTYETEICKYLDTAISVKTYDSNLNPINAEISYDCLGEKCEIGNTENDTLYFPQCVNGNIVAKADGYADTETLMSTVNEGNIEIIMPKLYELNIDLTLDNKNFNSSALISFVSSELSKTIIYPEQKTIELAEGSYEVLVQIYRDSSLTIGATTSEYCVEVPRSGIMGNFGFTENKCYEVELPEQVVTNVLAGGGKSEIYVLESTLASSNSVKINAQSLPNPTSLEQLQNNYNLFEEKEVSVNFI